RALGLPGPAACERAPRVHDLRAHRPRRHGAQPGRALRGRRVAAPVVRGCQVRVRRDRVLLQLRRAQASSFHSAGMTADRARAVIIGAGPAGLTAAHELVEAGVQDLVVLEATGEIGGLAQSVNYKGNRIDIGGHRFFSKSDWVMQWWLRMLPLAAPS